MQALVLSRRNFREADQIISLYTKEKGKLEVLARGVKKITSKNAAHLEPFSLVEVEIIPGKELAHLGAVQPINYFVNIRRDLQKSLAAGYVVGLLNKILHEGEKDERLFNFTIAWLTFVNISLDLNLSLFVDCYIVKLLYCLGFDIIQSENLSLELKKDLEILGSGDWQRIEDQKITRFAPKDGSSTGEKDYDKLHDLIYKFLVHHLERKIKDWSPLIK